MNFASPYRTYDNFLKLFSLIFQCVQSNYNYKSVGWGSVTESIEISADMPFYCFDCTVYLAVYGYRACSYSIQASSSGLTALQSGQATGGHVSDEKFVYYTIRNSNQFALMQFTLTMVRINLRNNFSHFFVL